MTSTLRHLNRSGSSLVEVLVSCTLLTVVVLGTSSQFYHSRADELHQRTRRLVQDAVSARLEELRTASFSALSGAVPKDYSLHYLTSSGGVWVAQGSDPGESLDTIGIPLPMTTTARFGDLDGGSASYDYLDLAVTVPLSSNGSEKVSVETWRAF